MSNVADFIKETCSTIGVGDLVLSGAYDTSVGRFSYAWSSPTEVYYSILDGLNRESGKGTFDGSNTLTRDTIYSTIEEGTFNDINPTAISLQGQSIVSCALSADAFSEVVAIGTQVTTNAGNINTNTTNIAANTVLIGINTIAIAGKTDKVIPATTNNLAALDASGNLTDSGKTTAQLTTTVNNTLTSTSTTEALSAAQGKVLNDNSIPSGTKMVFYQAAAPSGWTQVTTLNDYMLRVVSGSGGASGGSSSPIAAHSHTTVPHTHSVPAHKHTMPSHSHTGGNHTHAIPSHTHTTGNYTLGSSTIPSHTHSYSTPATGSKTAVTYAAGQFVTKYVVDASTSGITGSYGTSNAHNHGSTGGTSTSTINGGGVATSTNDPGDTNNSSVLTSGSASPNTGTSFTPKYINIILATKN